MLPMTEVTVRFWRREFGTAVAIGVKSVELHSYLPAGRAIYAQALEFSGWLDEALAQCQIASVMAPDLPWLRAHEGICQVSSADQSLNLGRNTQKNKSGTAQPCWFVKLLRGDRRRGQPFGNLDLRAPRIRDGDDPQSALALLRMSPAVLMPAARSFATKASMFLTSNPM
jgi:hypothetical protein